MPEEKSKLAEKYKEATTRDLGSLLGWFKNKWYDYHRTKHKLEEH